MSDRPLLEFEHITKRFGVVTALEDVTLSCSAGRVHALMGENGAGKSTLLGILAGSHPQTSGTMRVAGNEIDPASYSPQQALETGISVVFQEQALIPAMTVTENIFLGRELVRRGRLDRDAMRKRAGEALGRLGARVDVDAQITELSVAQAQLVEIARAIAFDTKILALDEPSAVLAGKELEALFEVVRVLRADGVAIVYVSHRLEEIFELCDDYTVLKDGRVAGSGQVAETTTDDVIRMMVGRDVDAVFPDRAAERGPALLQARGVSVTGLIEDVSFDAHAGEIVGLAGLIGSGRTTLGKALFGAIRITSGQVKLGDRTGPFRSPNQALSAGLAYLPEDRKVEGLALEKSVAANMSMLCAPKLRSGLRLISPGRERQVVGDTIGRVGVRTSTDGAQAAGRLSGGNQQKVVLAKWLLAEPRVLILDEPTRGIDIGAKEQIYTLLRRLADDGHAIVVISSELIELVGLCDRVLVMSEGRLRGELSAAEASEESIMRLATPVTRSVAV